MSSMKTVVWCGVLLMAVGACGSDEGGGGDGTDADAGADPGADADPQDLPQPPPFAQCAGQDPAPTFPGTLVCLTDVDAMDPATPPIAVIEHNFEDYMGTPAVHIRLTFDPAFVDNTFGTNAVGWDRGHKFKDLVGSDHAQVLMLDASGQVVFDVDIDYIEEDASAPCGYSSGGVTEGSGKINVGDEAAILAWRTSLDENLNDRGYCLTADSPVSDEMCTPDPLYPDWDFRVVYEIWVAVSAFDPAGFGSAHMDSVHASPAKGGNNTVVVEPTPCPDDFCNDPDGCEPGDPGGSCQDESECATNEFCYEGTCLPIVQ